MNDDATVVLHGFFQLPNLEKLKVVEAINEYFDSTEREPIRVRHDHRFEKLKMADPDFECKCCGRR